MIYSTTSRFVVTLLTVFCWHKMCTKFISFLTILHSVELHVHVGYKCILFLIFPTFPITEHLIIKFLNKCTSYNVYVVGYYFTKSCASLSKVLTNVNRWYIYEVLSQDLGIWFGWLVVSKHTYIIDLLINSHFLHCNSKSILNT